MPASRNYELDKGFGATAAVTKFRAVKLSAAGPQTVAPIAAAADTVFGVAQESLSTAEQARNFGIPVSVLASGGETEWEVGVAVAIGDRLVIDSAGRCVPVGTASAGTLIVGIARQAATTIGQRVTVAMGN